MSHLVRASIGDAEVLFLGDLGQSGVAPVEDALMALLVQESKVLVGPLDYPALAVRRDPHVEH